MKIIIAKIVVVLGAIGWIGIISFIGGAFHPLITVFIVSVIAFGWAIATLVDHYLD